MISGVFILLQKVAKSSIVTQLVQLVEQVAAKISLDPTSHILHISLPSLSLRVSEKNWRMHRTKVGKSGGIGRGQLICKDASPVYYDILG